MSEPEYFICLQCETPTYEFEYDGDKGKLITVRCQTCGADDPVDRRRRHAGSHSGDLPHATLNPRGARQSYYRFQCDLQESEQDIDNTDPDNLKALEKRGQALAEGDRFDEVSSRLLEIQVRRRSPAT